MKPEDLGYWYLRLNGFLTTVNFVVHPDQGILQRTDVDILGIRFPHRQELFMGPRPMVDHSILVGISSLPIAVITEVKRGQCNLNGPWIRPADQNLHRVLAAIGIFPNRMLHNVTAGLYEEGVYGGHDYYVTLLCLGARKSPSVANRYPKVPQITWEQILSNIWKRFNLYRREKASHSQWDDTGRRLWRAFESSSMEEFKRNVILEMAN